MRCMNKPALTLAFCLGAASLAAHAQTNDTATPPAATAQRPNGDYWRLLASPYTVHFSNEDEHEYVYMLGLERQRGDGWIWGGSYFSNSFGQPSGYLYLGQRITHFSRFDKLFAKWTVGILYGYKEPYEDKVLLNYNGFSPGGTLSLGWQFTREFSMQVNLLGTSGMMLQLSIDLR
jgi:hypothetical protein